MNVWATQVLGMPTICPRPSVLVGAYEEAIQHPAEPSRILCMSVQINGHPPGSADNFRHLQKLSVSSSGRAPSCAGGHRLGRAPADAIPPPHGLLLVSHGCFISKPMMIPCHCVTTLLGYHMTSYITCQCVFCLTCLLRPGHGVSK